MLRKMSVGFCPRHAGKVSFNQKFRKNASKALAITRHVLQSVSLHANPVTQPGGCVELLMQIKSLIIAFVVWTA